MNGTGSIRNGQIYYDQKLYEYIKEHEGSECDISIVVLNKPEHYLYRYLFGFLIKDVSFNSGMDADEVKDLMKERYAVEHVKEWTDVPRRHRKKCQRYEQFDSNGEIICRWYVKSCSSMSHEELMEFTKNVEHHFFDFMESAMSTMKERNLEAYENRKKGFMTAKELKKYKEENSEQQK